MDITEILSWILLVLVAAFIGQFGKTFAKFVMRKVSERRSRAGRGDEPVSIAERRKALGKVRCRR